jgi:hypothetical protein
MERALEEAVWRRAAGRCEYCQMPQSLYHVPFQIDHIIAQKHDGPTELDNLALTCLHCNRYKGPNIAGIDTATQAISRLFHPRRDEWHAHFHWNGPVLVGRTEVGRATIAVLRMNHAIYIAVRTRLIEEGTFPPQ